MDVFSNTAKTKSGISYYWQGEHEKSVLLVHGSFGTAMMWAMYVMPLVEAGYKVFALDLAGHGASEGDLANTNMDSYAQNVKEVVEDANIRPVLIGHSMSGLTVLMNSLDGVGSQIVSIDPSPSVEVQGVKPATDIPDDYTVFDAGMPTNPMAMMQAMPDISQSTLMKMKDMLGKDAGPARRQRKEGISIPKEKLDKIEVLFLGAEKGDSLPFGISAESTEKMAKFYDKPVKIIPDTTHPGMLMGKNAPLAIKAIIEFLNK